MINIGINGLGRIGKCILIQILNNKFKNINLKAINIPDFDIHNLETYLKNDSTHKYQNNFDIEIINSNTCKINNNEIFILNNREASKLNWNYYDINYVIDTTGVYLTQDKCFQHNVDYVIMCAPPKDNTKQFVFNVNHENYNGENIISNASCTTNCISPVLKFLDEKYKIVKSNFTTIHATTASQNTIDTNRFKNRTSRSILNNIIPHSTGASKSITKLLPQLENKIKGTSLRIPISNVSMVDLNIQLNKDVSFDNLLESINQCPYLIVNDESLVSSDFNTSCNPSIIDKNASMDLNDNEFKLMIWYDNEWSYSCQLLKLLSYIITKNESKKKNDIIEKNFIDQANFDNKNVILRVDWNIPFNIHTFQINDDFRIVSSLTTIKYILSKNIKRLLIISHLGRPKNSNDIYYSFSNFLEKIQTYIKDEIKFLDKGIHQESLNIMNENKYKVYLCENIRYHNEEISYCSNNNNNLLKIFNKMGDLFINDAFGCLHRNHMSICGYNGKKYYGYLIHKELNCLKMLTNNIDNEKILAIIGGGKIDDKLELLKNLSLKIDGIYIAGGNINSILKNDKYKNYLNDLYKNKSKIYMMEDGLGSNNIDLNPNYYSLNDLPEDKYFFDIGMKSIIKLNEIINDYDIIFWNGTLGVVENELYKYGSYTLIQLLMKSNKKIIIGGGDSACFVNKFDHNFYYVSTGGGATIDYISNNNLIGLNNIINSE